MLRGHDADRDLMLEHFGEPLELSMKKFFDAEGDTVKEYIDIYRSYQTDNFVNDIKLFPEVPEMLESLKNAGYTLCSRHLAAEAYNDAGSSEKFGLERYFDVVITANDCTKHKPDPRPE